MATAAEIDDLDELRALISDKTGIPEARCRLYTLYNEPVDSLADVLFTDLAEDHYSGYATKEPGRTQIIWVLDAKGYRDLLLVE